MSIRHYKGGSCLLFVLIISTMILQSHLSLPKDPSVKSILSKMQFMEGGYVVTGEKETTALIEKDSSLLLSYIPTREEVAPFYISATEVTNSEWRVFYEEKVKDIGIAKAAEYYPDTTVWTRDFAHSYNVNLSNSYFQIQEWASHPVVGISWTQAQAYCQWLSQELKVLAQKKKRQLDIEIRLPTEAEWEFAARGIKPPTNNKEVIHEKSYYGWTGNSYWDEGGYLANFGPIRDRNGVSIKHFPEDGCFYTCEVGSYPPNGLDLYDMSGNVAEWVEDKGRMHVFQDLENEKYLELDNPEAIKAEITSFEKNTDVAALDEHYLGFYTRMLHDSEVLSSGEVKLVKGGSWFDGMAYLQRGSREGYDKDRTSSKVGFRISATYQKEYASYFPKKAWEAK